MYLINTVQWVLSIMKNNKEENKVQTDMMLKYKETIEKEAESLQKKKALDLKKREYVHYDDYVISCLQKTVSQIVGCEIFDIQFSFPPENFDGDLSLST